MTARMLPLIQLEKLNILAFIDETGATGAQFMGRPVIDSLERAAAWNQALILVCARPFGRIRQKLLDAGFHEDNIVSLDIESDAHALAFQENAFDAVLRKSIMGHPLFSQGLNMKKLRKSAWFLGMVNNWTT